MPNNSIEHVTNPVTKATGKRFCNDHQGEAAIDAGSVVIKNKSCRWICFRCQESRKNAAKRSDNKS
jgi:hypothetical protein